MIARPILRLGISYSFREPHATPTVSLASNGLSLRGESQLKCRDVAMRRNHVVLHNGLPHLARLVI